MDSAIKNWLTIKKGCIMAVSGVLAIIGAWSAYHGFENHIADEEEVKVVEDGIRKDMMSEIELAAQERRILAQKQEIEAIRALNNGIMDKIKFWKQEISFIEYEYADKPMPLSAKKRIAEIETEITELEFLLQRN